MIDLTMLVQAVIILVSVIITTFVVPYVKSKTTGEKREQVLSWVRIAVKAAEQIYNGVGRGEEKKEYVINFLKLYGYTLDEDAIDALIESVVHELGEGWL